MAPPTTARAGRTTLLTALTGLVVLTVVPLAVIVVPNTISVVAENMPASMRGAAMLRAYGLAVPALVLTVPIGAVLVRLRGPAGVLALGLAVIAVADFTGGLASSIWHVGVLRALHGAGAGLALPATLMAIRERPEPARRWLLALWGATLAIGLLGAQAVAWWPLLRVSAWQIVLQPYPMFAGVALIVAAAYMAVRAAAPAPDMPSVRPVERSHLAMSAVPATGIAILAIGTTFQWPIGMQIAAAVLAILALCGLAGIGGGEGAPGRTAAFVSVAIGIAVLSAAAQTTSLVLRGFGGPGLGGTFWWALVAAAVAAAAGAAVAARAGDALLVRLAPIGLVVMVAGLAAIRLLVPSGEALLLTVPFSLIAAGAAMALVSALRRCEIGAGLFGLALCFPAVQVGFLLGGGLQVASIHGAIADNRDNPHQAVIDGLVSSARLWALVAAVIVVLLIALNTWLARGQGKLRPS